MSTPPAATVRETVDALGRRLSRISAVASSLNNLAADIRQGTAPADLMPLLDQLERDLLLASHEVEFTRERAKPELESLPTSGKR